MGPGITKGLWVQVRDSSANSSLHPRNAGHVPNSRGVGGGIPAHEKRALPWRDIASGHSGLGLSHRNFGIWGVVGEGTFAKPVRWEF